MQQPSLGLCWWQGPVSTDIVLEAHWDVILLSALFQVFLQPQDCLGQDVLPVIGDSFPGHGLVVGLVARVVVDWPHFRDAFGVTCSTPNLSVSRMESKSTSSRVLMLRMWPLWTSCTVFLHSSSAWGPGRALAMVASLIFLHRCLKLCRSGTLPCACFPALGTPPGAAFPWPPAVISPTTGNPWVRCSMRFWSWWSAASSNSLSKGTKPPCGALQVARQRLLH